ncbi:MAG: glycosyltransferase [Candidatus Zixiibacteriota bacterium]
MLRYPKICMITNRYPAHPDDVASPFVHDFHLGLKRQGVAVSVFTPYYRTEKPEWTEDVVRFSWRGGEKVVGSLNFLNPKEIFQFFSFLRNGKHQLLEHLRKTSPDHCLALWALPSGWLAHQAKRKLGIPYSVWCLGSDVYVWAKRPILRGVIKKILAEAEHLFADGFDLKQSVERLSGRKCIFLPTMRRLPPVSGTESLVNDESFNFLYVGRWEKAKGLDDLIQAIALVKSKFSSVRLYIVGWGGFEEKMKQAIGKLKLEEAVRLVGKVSAASVASYIQLADCVVIPSKGDSIPLVFSEALQMGTPLLVSDVGDMGHLVKRFRLGKVVPPGKVPELARAMIEFVCEKEDYSKSVPEVLRLLDIERAVEDYLKTIQFKEQGQSQNMLLASAR